MTSHLRKAIWILLGVSAGCGLEQGFQGRPRPLNEISVVVGGRTLREASAPYWVCVDLVAVPDVPELATSAGGMAERVYLLPGEHTLRVAFRKRFDAPLPSLLQAGIQHYVDDGVTTLRVNLEAGQTYIVHYDVGAATYWISASTSFMDQPSNAPLEPYPNSIECKSVEDTDSLCLVVDHHDVGSTEHESVK